HSSAAWRQVGHWYFELYQKDQREHSATSAVDCLRAAISGYPQSAILRSELASMLHATGNAEAARPHAQQALNLHELTPHPDKRLPPQRVQEMEQIVNQPLPAKAGEPPP